jgi:hypothetical protein
LLVRSEEPTIKVSRERGGGAAVKVEVTMPGTRKVEIRKETRLFDDFFSNRAAIAQNGLDPGERPLWEARLHVFMFTVLVLPIWRRRSPSYRPPVLRHCGPLRRALTSAASLLRAAPGHGLRRR